MAKNSGSLIIYAGNATAGCGNPGGNVVITGGIVFPDPQPVEHKNHIFMVDTVFAKSNLAYGSCKRCKMELCINGNGKLCVTGRSIHKWPDLYMLDCKEIAFETILA